MTTDTEALRARFERDFGKAPYYLTLSRFPEKSAWIGQYTELKTQCGWEGYQAGYAAAKAETANVGKGARGLDVRGSEGDERCR